MLEDVLVQLGLSTDGLAVMGYSKVADPWGTCHQLLGQVPPNDKDERLNSLKFSWLRENFETLSSSPTEFEIIFATRAYILLLLGGLALNSFSDVVLPAMSRDKSQDEEHKRLPSSAIVSGFTPNAIYGIRESPTTSVATY
ncbi:hypothetical protein Golax_010709 [Gossypium laxum]|uniref:Uncharacterized protein n=1 Tax=Gossypium laxum TaxID=34288 RepID=A0A7J8ZIB8_9ROSI|nr:hypothetical protein [Gossypium laxum]